jgi:hypothetical protein
MPDIKLGCGDRDGRQIVRNRAFLEGLARGFGGFLGSRPAVQQRCRLGWPNLLGLVDLRAFKRFETADLVHRQNGEELEEPADIGVLGVAPVLPEIIDR